MRGIVVWASVVFTAVWMYTTPASAAPAEPAVQVSSRTTPRVSGDLHHVPPVWAPARRVVKKLGAAAPILLRTAARRVPDCAGSCASDAMPPRIGENYPDPEKGRAPPLQLFR